LYPYLVIYISATAPFGTQIQVASKQ